MTCSLYRQHAAKIGDTLFIAGSVSKQDTAGGAMASSELV